MQKVKLIFNILYSLKIIEGNSNIISFEILNIVFYF